MSVSDRGTRFELQPCKVAGVVPPGNRNDGGWTAQDWLTRDVRPWKSFSKFWHGTDPYQDERKMAKFAQYAIAASQEALNDAGWWPENPRDQEMTVILHFTKIWPFS